MPPDTLRRLQLFFHSDIQARIDYLVERHALRLPELDILLELDEPRMSFKVPDTIGRFEFWLEPDGPTTRLIVDAFTERHEITANEIRVCDHPSPTMVAMPDDRATFHDLCVFVRSYNGYDLHGGPEGLHEVVIPVQQAWERTGEIPNDDVNVLRACLFFQQRAHYFAGGLWDFETEPFVVALLTRIRALSGGTVPVRSFIQ